MKADTHYKHVCSDEMIMKCNKTHHYFEVKEKICIHFYGEVNIKHDKQNKLFKVFYTFINRYPNV